MNSVERKLQQLEDQAAALHAIAQKLGVPAGTDVTIAVPKALDKLLAAQPASSAGGQEATGHSVLQVGGRGAAYDPPNTHRAFTYTEQPGNEIAWRLGEATRLATYAAAGDCIDRGLSLLKGLQQKGFGVFQIGTIAAPVAGEAAQRMTRAEAMELAREIIRHLGVIDSAIDEAIARMEADATPAPAVVSAVWNPASQPPESAGGQWSRPVIAVTVNGDAYRISAMGECWQRTKAMADSGYGGTVVAWTEMPDVDAAREGSRALYRGDGELVAPVAGEAAQVPLAVWCGAMPESNGKQNWTVILHRAGTNAFVGPHVCLFRSEYPDRMRYEADRLKYLLGQREEAPDILAYDSELHSGYVQPAPAAVPADAADFLFNLIKQCRSYVRRSGIRGNDYSLCHESRTLALRYEKGDFDKAMEECRTLTAVAKPQPAARGVDLGQFRQAVEQWKLHAQCRADERVRGIDWQGRIAEADRLLALIDSQQQHQQKEGGA